MGMRLGGSRRSKDSGFQWLIIGLVLGMGCTFTFMLSLYVFEIIEVTPLDQTNTAEDDSAPITQVVVITEAAPPITAPTMTIAPEPSGSNATDTTTDNADVTQTTSDSGAPTPLPGASQPTQSADQGQDTTAGMGTTTDSGTNTTGAANPTPTIGFSLNPDSDDTSTAPETGDGAEIVLTLPSTGIGGNAPPTTTGVTAQSLLGLASPLRAIEGGTFRMGTTEDEGRQAVAECTTLDGGTCDYDTMVADSVPAHEVFVDDFQMEQFEVSVAQYVAFLNFLVDQSPGVARPHLSACNGGPCAVTTSDPDGVNSDIAYDADNGVYVVRPDAFDRSNFPMTHVSWPGAQAYCAAIGRRLPTEAEWERAARGPNNNVYPWGFQWSPRDDRANTSRTGNANGGTWEVDTAVSESLTEDGLANMAGNVAEWTADYFSPTLYTQRFNSGQTFENPVNAITSATVVARGGMWDAVPLFSRAVHRLSFTPINFLPNVGFRCVE